MTLTMVSFSSALLSAINRVKATSALSARRRGMGSPNAELGTALGIYPVTDRDN